MRLQRRGGRELLRLEGVEESPPRLGRKWSGLGALQEHSQSLSRFSSGTAIWWSHCEEVNANLLFRTVSRRSIRVQPITPVSSQLHYLLATATAFGG